MTAGLQPRCVPDVGVYSTVPVWDTATSLCVAVLWCIRWHTLRSNVSGDHVVRWHIVYTHIYMLHYASRHTSTPLTRQVYDKCRLLYETPLT